MEPQSQNRHQQVISISQLYHDTLETYGKHILKFIGISLIPQLITVVLGIGLGVTVFSSALHLDTILALFSLGNRFSIMSLFLLILIAMVQIVGLCALAVMAVHRERISVLKAFQESLTYLWRYSIFGALFIGTWLLGALIAAIPLFILSTFLGAFSQDLLNNWFDYLSYLLPLGGTILSTYFTFAGLSIIDKNHSAKDAVAHSLSLVRGHFWPIAIRLLLGYAVVLTLSYLLAFIPFVSQLMIWMTISPLTVIYTYVLYRDLSGRKTTT
jgi:hypothetical protein